MAIQGEQDLLEAARKSLAQNYGAERDNTALARTSASALDMHACTSRVAIPPRLRI